MVQSGILPIIYGVITITIIFFFIQMLYSVEYTPGNTVIYNSSIAQKLFPNATNKLFPTWGSNKVGMYDNQPFKFGQAEFWPEKGTGFKPNKFGSTGASPNGGMRPSFSIPAETPVGYWGYTPEPVKQVQVDIYDNTNKPVEYITPLGWWNA